MKKILSLALAVVMLCSVVLTGCAKKTTEAISVCLASEPQTIDPALNSAVDGATMIIHAFPVLSVTVRIPRARLSFLLTALPSLLKV